MNFAHYSSTEQAVVGAAEAAAQKSPELADALRRRRNTLGAIIGIEQSLIPQNNRDPLHQKNMSIQHSEELERLDELNARISELIGGYFAFHELSEIQISDVESLLSENEYVLSMVVGEEDIFLQLLGRDVVLQRSISHKSFDLQEVVRRVRNGVDFDEGLVTNDRELRLNPGDLRFLYKLSFGVFDDVLWSGPKHIVFVQMDLSRASHLTCCSRRRRFPTQFQISPCSPTS